MRRSLVALLALLLSTPLLAADITAPDPKLTPGVMVQGVGPKEICTAGYSKANRRVTPKMKKAVYQRYGIKDFKHAYRIDHWFPICASGANVIENLWPQPVEQSYDKDVVERWVCNQFCSGKISMAEAREKIDAWPTVKVKRRKKK